MLCTAKCVYPLAVLPPVLAIEGFSNTVQLIVHGAKGSFNLDPTLMSVNKWLIS